MSVSPSIPRKGMETCQHAVDGTNSNDLVYSFTIYSPQGDGNLNFKPLPAQTRDERFTIYSPQGDGNINVAFGTKLSFQVSPSIPRKGMETWRSEQ